MKSHIKVCRSFLLFFGLFLAGNNIVAQVTIAPTNLYITDENKFGTYLVINSSNTPQEISVNFIFGYGKSNKNGVREYFYGDTLDYNNFSIAKWIRAFPQNFVLPPGQRQVVRLRINNPNNLDDGTYWARIKTTSSPVSPPIELESNNNVSAAIGVKIEQISGVFFKKGDVNTGIEIQEIRTSINEEALTILTDIKRLGNSPFLGTITATLSEQNGNIVGESFVSTSIYFDETVKQEINISDLNSGTYELKIEFRTSRGDISDNDIVKMNPVSKTEIINIQ